MVLQNGRDASKSISRQIYSRGGRATHQFGPPYGGPLKKPPRGETPPLLVTPGGASKKRAPHNVGAFHIEKFPVFRGYTLVPPSEKPIIGAKYPHRGETLLGSFLPKGDGPLTKFKALAGFFGECGPNFGRLTRAFKSAEQPQASGKTLFPLGTHGEAGKPAFYNRQSGPCLKSAEE